MTRLTNASPRDCRHIAEPGLSMLLWSSILGAHRTRTRLPPYGDRWVYCSFNLQVDKSVDDLIALIERASRAGYTGILLADYKFQVPLPGARLLLPNVEACKAAAGQAKIELIPAVFSIGYSNGHPGAGPEPRRGPAGRRPAVSSSKTSRGRSGRPSGGPAQERRSRT